MVNISKKLIAIPKVRVAVMGAGAIGGYLGALLSRAGNDVTLVARGKHLEAIQTRGLNIVTPESECNVTLSATDQPESIGKVDLVLFTVKTYHNQEAIPLLQPLLSKETAVLTIQNGVESVQHLEAVLGKGRVIPAAMYIEAKVESPGVIAQRGNVFRLVLGETNGVLSNRVDNIARMLQHAGMPTEVSADIQQVLWSKWLFITTLAGVTAASRAELAELLAIPESRDLLVQVMREIEALGRKKGIDLGNDVVDRTLFYMNTEARDLKASMYTDLERGKPLELEALNGAAVRFGKKLSVPTPANQVIYSLLKIHDLQYRADLDINKSTTDT